MRTLLCGLWLAWSITSSAQLNSKVGYTLGVYGNPAYAELIERYNAERPWLEPLPDRDLVSGITIGLRYRHEAVGFELSWRNQFTNNRSTGTDPATGSAFERRLATRLNSFSFGSEIYAGPIALGASIDRSSFGVRTEVTGTDGPFDVVDGEHAWGHTLYLSLEPQVGDGRLSLAIRPYWQAFWDDFGFGGLGDELEPDRAATAPAGTYRESFGHWGVMLIFYNGEK